MFESSSFIIKPVVINDNKTRSITNGSFVKRKKGNVAVFVVDEISL